MRLKFWITKIPWTIAHEYQQNGGFTCSRDRLTLIMGRFGCEGQLAQQVRSEFWISKKSMAYSTQKSTKWGVYLFWTSFDLDNGPFWL
ncbi:hypothetical protein H5410_064069 [Solanum commersonii]|uniref:Uncharacterized protein n=1 Tax=Solanum commersonii TaxID=4109 RepID=A0A9J5W0H4_SOLCO|nr:hypothetical protein H5410_064069 [Solanum commersonii]